MAVLDLSRQRAERAQPRVASPTPGRNAAHPHTERGLPARYAAVVVASALLLIAGTFAVPLGPGAGTPLRGILTAGLTAAGLALLLRAALPASAPAPARPSRAYRRLRVPALGLVFLCALVTAAIFAGGLDFTVFAPPSQAYQTDVVAFADVDARLALAGRNPYTADGAFWSVPALYPWAEVTPMRAGAFAGTEDFPPIGRLLALARRDATSASPHGGEFDPRTLHSYPALSFLLYAPLLLAGMGNILPLNLLAFCLLFAWLLWQAPVGWRHWGALAAAACVSVVGASLYMDTEVVCLLFILGAWHWRSHRWRSALLLGLGCAFKQYCWFFAPLFLLDAAREDGWAEGLKRGLIAAGAFLLPNLPYLTANPAAWWTSLWLPMTDPMFPSGQGLIALSTGHLLPYGPQSLYAALEGLAFVVALGAALRWREKLGDGVLVLPLLPLFFAFRSNASYFAFAPWLALYAVHRLYAAWRASSPLAERMRGSAYALAVRFVSRPGSSRPLPATLRERHASSHAETCDETPMARRRRVAGMVVPHHETAGAARDARGATPGNEAQRPRSCA